MQTGMLDYGALGISEGDIYEQMGYDSGDVVGEGVRRETAVVVENVRRFLRPRYCFVIAKGCLSDADNTLSAAGMRLHVGPIISRQLHGSEMFAFFVATSGTEFENFQQQTKRIGGDMVKVYIAHALGSVIAERTADRMEEALQRQIAVAGWRHTNRFSPGYCGWHVSEQASLFHIFATEQPCGVRLTPGSCLMVPIKSVSGVIGIGANVRRHDYTCGLCDYAKCYKKKHKKA